MIHPHLTYEDALRHVYTTGTLTHNRTGVDTKETFDGTQIMYDLRQGFPLVTTKRVAWKTAFREMFWFLNGNKDIRDLHTQNVHIWDEWHAPAPIERNMSVLLNPVSLDDLQDFSYVSPSHPSCPTPLRHLQNHGIERVFYPSASDWSNPYSPRMCDMYPSGAWIKETDRVLYPLSVVENDSSTLVLGDSPEGGLWSDESGTYSEQSRTLTVNVYRNWWDLGPIYGRQWRSWKHGDTRIDQLKNLVDEIRENPSSRRLILSAWNVGELDEMALPPCPIMVQFNVDTDNNVLNAHVYQRSADMFLGVPFDIAGYSLLLTLIAHSTGYTPGRIIWTGGSTHIYRNCCDQVQEQIEREPYPLPHLEVTCEPKMYPWEYSLDDIQVTDYVHHSALSAPVVP